MKKLLIIEDDPSIQKGLVDYFTEEKYDVVTTKDGEKGCLLAKKENPDLVLLDLILPGRDGIEICRELRQNGFTTPIIMLTSKKEEMDKIIGLEIGADDYVTKPFSIRELHARIKAVMRRNDSNANDLDEYDFDKIHISFKNFEAKKGIDKLDLSNMEFKMLKYFAAHEGEVVSREKFLDDVWGYEQYPSTRTVDNFILSLRKKIEDDPAHPKHILTVHKAGYKFVK